MPADGMPDIPAREVTPLERAKGLWAFDRPREVPGQCRAGEPRGAHGSKPLWEGAYVGQHLSFARLGKATNGSARSRSEPDWGNPTVRDRRGACGTAAVRGVGLRAAGKPAEEPPNPTAVRAPHFYPDPPLRGR
jgi:hypothetical protein